MTWKKKNDSNIALLIHKICFKNATGAEYFDLFRPEGTQPWQIHLLYTQTHKKSFKYLLTKNPAKNNNLKPHEDQIHLETQDDSITYDVNYTDKNSIKKKSCASRASNVQLWNHKFWKSMSWTIQTILSVLNIPFSMTVLITYVVSKNKFD